MPPPLFSLFLTFLLGVIERSGIEAGRIDRLERERGLLFFLLSFLFMSSLPKTRPLSLSELTTIY